MQEQFERYTEFRRGTTKRSLLDLPFVINGSFFETSIFHLPQSTLGSGDTLFVSVNDGLNIVLVSDFPEKEDEGRERIRGAKPLLENIVRALETDNPKIGLQQKLFEFETYLADITQAALTLVRLEPDGTLYYLNAGENYFMNFNGREFNPDSSNESPGNTMKMGFISTYLSLRLGLTNPFELFTKFSEIVMPEMLKVSVGDRIIVASDGISDFGVDTIQDERLYAQEILGKMIKRDPENALAEYNKLFSQRTSGRVNDDYTMIITAVK
jgi:hypothetical protein